MQLQHAAFHPLLAGRCPAHSSCACAAAPATPEPRSACRRSPEPLCTAEHSIGRLPVPSRLHGSFCPAHSATILSGSSMVLVRMPKRDRKQSSTACSMLMVVMECCSMYTGTTTCRWPARDARPHVSWDMISMAPTLSMHQGVRTSAA